MSDWAQGPGWWQASDGRWYPPETHPNFRPPPPPVGSYEQNSTPHARRRTVLLGVVGTVALIVILVVVLVLVSSHGPGRTVATFVPVSPSASAQQLADDANQLSSRLNAIGDTSDSVAVRGRTVVVLGGTGLPIPASELLASGTLQFRPALCQADPYSPPNDGPTLGPLPSACSSSTYSIQLPPTGSLSVDSSGTSDLSAIPSDPVLSGYETTQPAYDDLHPHSPVLIPLVGGAGFRNLLGPAEMNGTAVASAMAQFTSPDWVVNTTLTSKGATEWDNLTKKYFHEIIGIDFDGQEVSNPLTLPGQATWISFGGRVQISGNFTKRSAEDLAASLDSGPFATPLQVRP